MSDAETTPEDVPAAVFVSGEQISEEEDTCEGDWPLGDDSDCETCGWSSNTLWLQVFPSTNTWNLYVSVGCTGGWNTDDSGGLEPFLDDLERYPDFNAGVRAEVMAAIAAIDARRALMQP